jgi:hypothetical protein
LTEGNVAHQTREALDLELSDQHQQKHALREIIEQHRGTVLLPYRGYW